MSPPTLTSTIAHGKQQTIGSNTQFDPNINANDKGSTNGTSNIPSTVRIASLLPFITDIVHELKLSHLLCAVSHECHQFDDSEKTTIPQQEKTATKTTTVVTRAKLKDDHTTMTTTINKHIYAAELSAGWNQVNTFESLFHHQQHENETFALLSSRLCSFYMVDVSSLIRASPTVILTHIAESQEHTLDVSVNDIISAIRVVCPSVKQVYSLNASSLSEVYEMHHKLATVCNPNPNHTAIDVVASGRGLLRQVEQLMTKTKPKPTIAIVQWTSPTYLAGGYVPELVHIAGGRILAPMPEPGMSSQPVSCGQLLNFDVVVFVPCAMTLEEAQQAVDSYWNEDMMKRERNAMERIQHVKCAVVDGIKLFSWMGITNVVKSTQVLAEIVHGREWFGHKGRLWKEWSPPSSLSLSSSLQS